MKNLAVIVLFGLAFSNLNAQIINFPDANLKAKLLISNTHESIARNSDGDFITLDTNGDNEIDVTEAQAAYYIIVDNAGISTLSGIENFTNLKSFGCRGNNLSSLAALSTLTNLIWIGCENNNLTSISEIESLPNLQELNFSNNPISTVNLSNYHQMWRLNVSNTLLSEINLCGTSVRWLWLENNPNLHTLYLKNNVVSSDYARTTAQIPPPLHNFEFFNSTIQYICYDEGELPAIMHTVNINDSGLTLTTSCDSQCTLSVENPALDNSILLYPNPTSGILNVSAPNQQMHKISVSNLSGQTLMASENSMTIDLCPLTTGTYFITIETDINKKTQKIIKQ